MLAAVLLHMIEPPDPVDLAPNAWSSEGSRKQVGNPLALVHHVGDFDSAQKANIEWLTPGGGVESRLVEVDAAGIVGAVDDLRLEIAEVGVGVVESVGHPEPRLRRLNSREPGSVGG